MQLCRAVKPLLHLCEFDCDAAANVIRNGFAAKSQNHADSTAIQLRISCNSVANCKSHCDLKSLPLCKMSSEEAILLLAEEEMILLATATLVADKKRKKRRCNRRKLWVKPWLLRRMEYGQYEKLLFELQSEDARGFKNFVRVDHQLFQELIDRVGPRLEKRDSFMRKALEPGLRLAITLRYLATGDSYTSLQYGFRVAHSTISLIVPETCEAIIHEYMEEVVRCPCTPDEWRKVSQEFSARWDFHNTLGALDGKHIPIRCPRNGGSLYFNYKGFHSIVLLALVDANYKFLYVDVGANGSSSDGGIFKDSSLFEAFNNNFAGIPQPEPLPQDDLPVPYSITADDAFGLRSWLMKPFSRRNMSKPQRIFNYRLSRARRVVENAFGILAHR